MSPRLAGQVRASALSLLMGILAATQAVAAATAGLVADAVGLLPVCVALGVPPLAVGAWALIRPVRSPAAAVPDADSAP